MQTRTALVTGATGFLGGRLARRLHDAGWRVTAVGRNVSAGQALQTSGIHFVRADLANPEAALKVCAQKYCIFHCAARSSPWGRYRDFHNDNVIATQNLLTACAQNKIARFIHVSTPSVYFDFQNRFNIDESGPIAPRPANDYVRTKLIAEASVDAAAARGLPVMTLRPRAIFGPGDTTLFPRLIRAHGSRGFPLIGDDDPLMDITYVDNVVDALMLAAEASDNAVGKKFNITNGDPWPRSRLLETLFAEIGKPLRTCRVSYLAAKNVAGALEIFSRVFTLSRWEPPLTRYTVGVLAKSQTLDISAARDLLGYSPRVNTAEGLRAFGAWWKEQTHAT